MKVLFLSSMYYKPQATDAGLAIHRQAVELQRRGVKVQVVCPVPRFTRSPRMFFKNSRGRKRLIDLGTVEVDGVSVTYLPYLNVPLGISPGAHVSLLRDCVARYVHRLRPSFPFDLLHAHRLFPTGFAALRIARRYAVPLIASAVGSDVHTYPHRSRAVRRRTETTIARGDAVVAVSQALAQDIYRLAQPIRPVRVVYRGVDTDRFSPAPSSRELRTRLGLPADGLGICTVCRLLGNKGLLELLEVTKQIAGEMPGVWLTIIGDGPLRRELRSRIKALGLQGRVFLAGARPHDEVPAWLNASDVFVLASYQEGLPNVIREAMSCARPVVATDVGGVAEAVDDGLTGILVPPRTVEPLRLALERLLRDPSLRREMGMAGRDVACSKFSWTRSAMELQAIYAAILDEARSGSENKVHPSQVAHQASPRTTSHQSM